MHDVTLTPATDGTYAIATLGRTDEITRRLRRAGIGHMLGWDPKSPAERAAVEGRIRVGGGCVSVFDRAEVDRLVGNARRLGKDALALACALDLLAPIPGRTWVPVCCSCLDELEPACPDELVLRVSLRSWQSAGPCGRCPYAGPDTLVAAVLAMVGPPTAGLAEPAV